MSGPTRSTLLSLLALAGLALAGCNQYAYLRVSGYAQESFANEADILFVVDNSPSMGDEAQALATNFNAFVRALSNPSGGEDLGGLAGAVDDYIAYSNDRAGVLDYQLAITTTDVASSYGALYGEPAVLTKGDAGIAEGFSANLLCHATCFNPSLVPDDPSYHCGAPLGSTISTQYLDCTCGEGAWEDNCGEGQEEGLEAVYMAMCRAVEDPPAACFEQDQFTSADVLSNQGLLRPGSSLIAVIVTDEGDTSRRIDGSSGDPFPYPDLFDEFGVRMRWSVIGPRTDVCNSGGATTWGVSRYHWFVDETGGSWMDISEPTATDGCAISNFASSMERLGQLLSGLLDMFPLQGVPDVDSLLVFVDGAPVPQAEEQLSDTGDVRWEDGWSYLPSENAVVFHGDAVPDYNAEVAIYYLPLEGMPRELPY